MILRNLTSWPLVVAGRRSAADATLGHDPGLISDFHADTYGDVILGVDGGTVVTAFDITGFTRDPGTNQVTFTGAPSADWRHLVGGPSPVAFVVGLSPPLQFVATAFLRRDAVGPELVGGAQQAVVAQYVLTVDADGTATLRMPAGGSVTVVSEVD